MYSTQVFYYTQRKIAVVLSGTSVRSYMPQYAKPLTLHKGVDNQLQFQFLNQEQKPVDITGKEIKFRIINYEGNAILVQKALTIQYGLTGLASVFLDPADIEGIDSQKCYYTLEIPVGQFNFPVFVDQNAGGRGDLNIVNSILPSFVPSQPVTIPTGQGFPTANMIPNVTANVGVFYSSVITTDGSPTLTLQASYANFTGNVLIEGSTIVDDDWYPIGLPHEYANTTDTFGYTIKGYHPFVRMAFTTDTSNVSVVTNILAR